VNVTQSAPGRDQRQVLVLDQRDLALRAHFVGAQALRTVIARQASAGLRERLLGEYRGPSTGRSQHDRFDPSNGGESDDQ
ncbi:hypothetical protein, partial [Campylobacter jejuni]|uniref:hypothetical protein n=1 Tax=Campylobacter jejuni TaxID=197 RepID=UPI001AE02E33